MRWPRSRLPATPVMPRRTGLRPNTFTGKPGQRWAITSTPNARSPPPFSWHRVGPRRGLISALRVTGRGTSRGSQDRDAPGAAQRPRPSCGHRQSRRLHEHHRRGRGRRGPAARQPRPRAGECSGARLNLAAGLLQEERPAEALALLDAAPALPEDKASLRHWHLQRALALLQLGRPAEAWPVLAALAALSRRFRPNSRRCGTGGWYCWR